MDKEYIEEMFASLGAVTVKRLFGGQGIYHEGTIVGAVMDGEILLKADAESALKFLAAGAEQWVYTFKSGKKITMPYWSIPNEALDDPNQLAKWVELAYEAAKRAADK